MAEPMKAPSDGKLRVAGALVGNLRKKSWLVRFNWMLNLTKWLNGLKFLGVTYLVPPWKLAYPLKNDGWKMYFLLK